LDALDRYYAYEMTIQPAAPNDSAIVLVYNCNSKTMCCTALCIADGVRQRGALPVRRPCIDHRWLGGHPLAARAFIGWKTDGHSSGLSVLHFPKKVASDCVIVVQEKQFLDTAKTPSCC